MRPWPKEPNAHGQPDWKEHERCLIGECKKCERKSAILIPLAEFEQDSEVGICTICHAGTGRRLPKALSHHNEEGKPSMFNRKKLIQFLNRNVLVETDDGPCRSIVLRHLIATEKTSNVDEWSASVHSKDIEQLADLIIEKADEDAEGLGGMQQYVVRVFHGDNKKPSPPRLAARVLTQKDDDDDEGSSEPANAKGQLAQQMRHNEAMMRMTVGTTNEMLRAQGRLLEMVMARLEVVEKGRTELLTLSEDLLSHRHERELDLAARAAKEKRTDDALGKVMMLAPAIVNKMAGQRLLPETISPEMDQIKTLLASLSMEQIQQLGTVLNPAQLTSVLTLYETMQKQTEADTKSKAKAK